MKKVISVSVEEGVWERAREASHAARVSLSCWVEAAIIKHIGKLASGEGEFKFRKVSEPVESPVKKVVGPDLRARYKLRYPRQMCPKCHERNEHCVC
jgi:hypothetical protein